jgi:hypothetical protein
MNYITKISTAGAMAAALIFAPTLGASPAQAMPNFANAVTAMPESTGNLLHKAEWYQWDQKSHRSRRDHRGDRRNYRRYNRRHDNDINPGAFIALGIVGALIDQGLNENEARSAMQRCDNRFNSFEWDTGRYTTYGGDRRLCPYLR